MTLPQQQQPPASQPQSQHFLLKWNNHRSNMVSVFESLLQSENLVDVTLAVEGKFLKGHKIVLSACSPYFESMFVNQTPGEKHPILIFHDMKFSHLKTLLDFMYRGEISIDEKDLSDVLKVAEALSIRGLSSFESDDEDSSEKSCEQNGNNDSPAQNTSTNNVSSGTAGGTTGAASGFGFSNNNSSSSNGASTTNNNESNNQSPNQSDNQTSSGNMNCDSSVNGSVVSSNNKSQSKGSASVRGQKKGSSFLSTAQASSAVQPPATPVASATVKRRRGRQPVRKDTAAASASPSRASPYKQPHIDRNVKPLTNRQRVRRRMPRQFSIPSAINPGRVKVEKHSDTEETGAGVGSGTTSPEDDEMDTADFMVPDMDGASGILPPDICNSEPLSEMSVRGLDLFKYASIEDGVYRCIECEKLCIPKTFKNKYSFQRHAFLYHEGNMRKVFPCPVCSREFSRPDKMKNHLRSIHEGGKGVRHNNGPGINDPQSSSTGDSNDFKIDKCDV